MDHKYYAEQIITGLKHRVLSRNPYKVQCRCPLCGDSMKNKSLMRGYFLESKKSLGYIGYYCHNCGASMTLPEFMELEYPDLYRQFCLDVYRTKREYRQEAENKDLTNMFTSKLPEKEPVEEIDLPWTCVTDLPDDHVINRYLRRRGVENFSDFYFTQEFKHLSNLIYTGEPLFDDWSLNYEQARIVTDIVVHGERQGIVGRAISKNIKPRYMITKVTDDSQMVYNVDNVDITEDVFVCEGVFDAEILNNAVAQLGLGKTLDSDTVPARVWCMDNEPYNPDVYKRMINLLELGERLVNWSKLPHTLSIHKDLSAMFTDGGASKKWLNEYVRSNIVQGQTGILEVNKWSGAHKRFKDTPSKMDVIDKFREKML